MGPGSSHELDLKLRRLGIENIIGRGMQFWFVASTIIATALFGFVLWKNRREALPITSVRFEGIMLLSWWLALLGICAYFFMLGMGG
jgi:hypothetical protein